MFIAIMKSRPNTIDLRTANRAAHDAYWITRMEKLWLAGPILSDDQSERFGQVLIIDTDNRQEAEELIGNDPFVLAGLFEDYPVRFFRKSVEKGQSI
ncbi:YciI family protein [Mesorhizobium sp. P5_C1]